MSRINLDLPRSAVATHVTIAALAAVGLISIVSPSGGRHQAVLVVPLLTMLLAVTLIMRTRETVSRARQAAGSEATVDSHTGTATATVGEEVLRLEFAAAQRGRPLAIVLTRIDGLSRYRVQHGAAVADQLLRQVGRTLQRHRRSMHLAARHEDDEATFLTVLSGSDLQGAAVYATRVRRDLLRLPGLPEPQGVSVGIAGFDLSMEAPASLVAKAEFALQRGAAAGGKVVVVGASAGPA